MNLFHNIFIKQQNFLILFTLLELIPLPHASHQNQDYAQTSVSSPFQAHNSPTNYYKLLLDKSTKGNTPSGSSTSSVLLNISDKVANVDDLANLAEELSAGQSNAKALAAYKAKQKLADISLQWASFAQKLTQWKSVQVMELTRKAQAAQIMSLKIGSIATRLNSAVMAAQDVYNSAFDRYQTLSSLAEAAENYSTAASRALMLLQYTQSVREKWASDEQARAFRLSKHLQNILYDLKKATEFAQEAHDHALSTKQYIHFHY